jgi:hypothetical protein
MIYKWLDDLYKKTRRQNVTEHRGTRPSRGEVRGGMKVAWRSISTAQANESSRSVAKRWNGTSAAKIVSADSKRNLHYTENVSQEM